ncbi:hypothetical protein SAMN05216249_11567 [Acetitomaculum ruminis DSM 5522]|uniref:Uncharacterized protein n=1 Tax=Acetitomaculum ruminis DSM 5522 TaxID=1120918 RepID=A0A1I0ZIF0_9FIRM|nr:hypothetical protein [Acetitomaculum ruminis]SFB25425.1 hypothetical protein SAMN05216249_11567 [Acetitomaculum ruminis DSM 5522]
MAVGPVEFNGTIQRVQDVSIIKQQQDNKSMNDQSNFQQQFNKEVQDNSSQVTTANNADMSKQKFDAREEGKNKYLAKKRKEQQKKEDEELERKVSSEYSTFDVTI